MLAGEAMSAETKPSPTDTDFRGLGEWFKIIKYLVVALFIGVPLIFTWVTGVYIVDFLGDRALSLQGVTSSGTVLAKEYRGGRGVQRHVLTYTFLASNGARVKGQCFVREGSVEEGAFRALQAGGAVEVLHLPEQPERSRVQGICTPRRIEDVLLMAILVVPMVLSLVAVCRRVLAARGKR